MLSQLYESQGRGLCCLDSSYGGCNTLPSELRWTLLVTQQTTMKSRELCLPGGVAVALWPFQVDREHCLEPRSDWECDLFIFVG